MKRTARYLISILLLGAMLLSLTGCVTIINDGDVFEKFMDALCEFDYHKAYGYLSVYSSAMPTPTPAAKAEKPRKGETVEPTAVPTATPVPYKFITEEEFTEKYEKIFSAIEVSAVRYEKLSEEEDDTGITVYYTATYVSDFVGEINNEYSVHLRNENGAWRIDWAPSVIFPGMDWGDTVMVSTVAAKRGDILANDELLAETVTLNAVIGDTEYITDIPAFIEAVSEILGLEPEAVAAKFENVKGDNVLIAQLNDYELTPDIHEALDNLTGARIIENYGTDRIYPQGELMAHTIGYVGYIEESEVDALNEGRQKADGLYSIHSVVGRSGLEKAYETILRGKDGVNITIRNKDGEYLSTVFRKPVENGADLHLTIDLDLQRRAEQVTDLVLWGDDTAAAVVVMNPKTGEIKALLSYPEYDLNKMAIHAEPGYYQSLMDQPNNPLQNRTTLGLYAPGSSMKVFTASAALELGYVTSDYVFTGNIVNDYWTPTGYGTWIWPPIKRTEIKERHEPLNMANGLLHSDNIYFANLALMMGEDVFFEYLRNIGFEQSFPFELNVARSTLKVRYDSDYYWNLRSIAETGYGQGQVTISPLQLAAMYCAFRHDGSIPTPRLAKALYKNDGVDYHEVQAFESSIWIENAIEESTIETLEPMMQQIMTRGQGGTGRFLRARGVTVAGKTGTAEIGSDKTREVSWFIGYRLNVPEEDELLVLVMLEIPTTDEYKHLKFDIARELISIDEEVPETTPDPNVTPSPEETPTPEETLAPEETPEPEETLSPEETPEPTGETSVETPEPTPEATGSGED
jgi:penicillin-binding protein